MIESWDSFFVAETAAAAALLGLMFVAVSINLKQVIESGGLADRALSALGLLLAILLAGLLLAMPGQGRAVLGSEAIVVAVAAAAVTTVLGLRGLKAAEAEFRGNFARSLGTNFVALAPIAIGGALLVAGNETGLYWIAVGMCLTILKAVTEGWIFLVEINR